MTDSHTPAHYFEQLVPQQFAQALANSPASVADQPELTATYEINGPGGATYGLRASGGQLDVTREAIPTCDMHTSVSIDDWRAAVATGAPDPLVDYVSRRKVALVKALRGTLNLELARPDGGTFSSTTVFGGQAEPSVTLRMNADDYVAMLRGELNGQMAFLTGKLKFDGSLPLLMQLAALNS